MNELVLIRHNFGRILLGRVENKLEKCLAKKQWNRYPDCAAALADLNLHGLKVNVKYFWNLQKFWKFQIRRDVVEVMLDTLEVYARDLERQIIAKRDEYKMEQKRADD